MSPEIINNIRMLLRHNEMIFDILFLLTIDMIPLKQIIRMINNNKGNLYLLGKMA